MELIILKRAGGEVASSDAIMTFTRANPKVLLQLNDVNGDQ